MSGRGKGGKGLAVKSEKNEYHIKGDTFPIKKAISQIGGKWDAKNKEWIVVSDLSSEEIKEEIISKLFEDVCIE